MLHVTYNADDLPWPFLVHGIRVIAQKDLLPDWIFVGKEAMREGLVHDDSPRGSFRIVLVQIASFFQRNLEGAEEARTEAAPWAVVVNETFATTAQGAASVLASLYPARGLWSGGGSGCP